MISDCSLAKNLCLQLEVQVLTLSSKNGNLLFERSDSSAAEFRFSNIFE